MSCDKYLPGYCISTEADSISLSYSLIESLYILDSYRVVLLQRPPLLTWHSLERLAKSPREKNPSTHLRNIVRALASPGLEVDFNDVQEFSLSTLSGLTPFLWQAMPLVPADQDSIVGPWRTDFVELAIDKWLRMHRYEVHASSQTLYHLMHMAMHANLLAVNNYAQSQASRHKQDCTKGSWHDLISKWVHGRHYEVAAWHADSVLECVESAVDAEVKDVAHNRHSQGQHFPVSTTRSAVDIVHVPYTVYYATLVLWCKLMVVDEANPAARHSCLRRGRDILKQLKLRIAAVLEGVLRKLRT